MAQQATAVQEKQPQHRLLAGQFLQPSWARSCSGSAYLAIAIAISVSIISLVSWSGWVSGSGASRPGFDSRATPQPMSPLRDLDHHELLGYWTRLGCGCG